jgi:predicted transcriptional regulator
MSRQGNRRESYPDALVAKVKGAAKADIPHKVIAKLTGVSPSAISAYACELSRTDVQADDSIVDYLRAWFGH